MDDSGNPKTEITKQKSEFRWQALLQRSSDPVFVLNRGRRILFVNQAWENMTGLSAAEARGLLCIRRTPSPLDPRDLIIRALCCPPPEVLKGQAARARRLVPGTAGPARWWDFDFFPLQDAAGLLCVLGKIAPEVRPGPAAVNPLPDKLAALCERRRQEYGLDQLASHLEIFGRVREQVRLAAATEVPVLILGEAGSGKQWLARTIHQQSKMPVGSFAGLDCGALPVRALTTVLFGDGTSAERCRPGTIYLREPARLPLDLQVKLAGTLREAGECPAPRILAGSETDPQEDIRAGRLNEDFFCALSTLTITLPPLRQREADLAELVERLLKRARAAGDSMVTGLTSEAWEVVRAYPWPGNLQELYGVLRSACLRATGEMIDVHHLPAPVRLLVRLQREPGALPDKPLPLDQLLEEAERRLIGLALRKAQGNRSRAAELLAIWRPRLLRRMEALGIKE